MNDETDFKTTIGRALGRLPSGIFILTVGSGDAASVMLVSWVQQAGFDPPMVTLALARGREIAAQVKSTRLFGLSVLGEGDAPLMKKYARGIIDKPFEDIRTQQTPRGVTILADALAWLECELVTIYETPGADHDLVLARITAGNLLKEEKSFVHLRGNGLRY